MRSFGTLVLAFLLSGFIAGTVQGGLAQWFKADETFIVAIMALVLMTLVATIALGIALAVARTMGGVNRTAIGLLAFTALGLAALVVVGLLAGSAASARAAQTKDFAILVEIFLPTVMMIVIQWWLVRRRWLRRAARAAV